jgi:hypothetical protein
VNASLNYVSFYRLCDGRPSSPLARHAGPSWGKPWRPNGTPQGGRPHYLSAQRIQRAGRGHGRARVAAGENDQRVPPSSQQTLPQRAQTTLLYPPRLPHRAHTSTLGRDDRTPQSSLTDRWLRSAAVGGRRVVPRDADKRRLGDGRRHCTTGGRKSRTNDGSKSRQAAADGDTMAGTVGGRGEKTRVVHPLSKRISHSKGGKQ